MFHTLIYEEALAAGAAGEELDAVVDDEFSRRNLHYIFGEDWSLIADYYQAVSAIRARWNLPFVNAIGRHNITQFHRSATVPTDPRLNDYRDYPIPFPQDEEWAVEGFNNLACGTENSTYIAWVAPHGWNRNLPRGEQRLTLRATAAVAGVAQSWSLLGPLAFESNIRGGIYAVVGCQMFDAGTLAGRLVFNRMPLYQGRKCRPGFLSTEALGNTLNPVFMGGLGEWGRFDTFEPPQLQIYANATAASAQELWLDCVYLGRGRL